MILYYLLGIIIIVQQAICDPSCINPQGQTVDWWITLKLNVGDDYAYCDAVGCAKIALSGKKLNDPNNSPLLRTLKQIEKGINLPQTIGYLLWNDDPPNGYNATNTNAHAKGFMGFGKTSGFLVVHSTPEFPQLDKNLEMIQQYIEDSQLIYGQHFLCTTTTTQQLESIACGYNIDNPKVYFSRNPFTGYKCLDQMIQNKRNTKTMSLIVPYKTLGGFSFQKFSKSLSNNTPLYEQIVAPALKTGLLVQSWGRPHEGPTCTGQYRVISNKIVNIEGAPEFKDSQDHSKYGISIDKTLPYICLGDINRMKSQWTRGGGTVCFQDQNIHKQFTKILKCSGCFENLGYQDINNVCDTTTCQQCIKEKCDDTCNTCTAYSDPNTCSTCPYGFYLEGTSCLPCKSPCASCAYSNDICFDCVENYILDNTFCKLNCDPSCLTCSEANNPETCLSCPPGKYLKDKKCVDCIPPCSQCSNGDTKSCSACITDYKLSGTECKPICDSSCLTCSQPNNPQTCLSCSSDKYLTATKECQNCSAPCSQCKDSATNCTGCIQNYTFSGQKCQPNCDSSCVTCQKPVDSSSCLTCSSNSFLSGGKCLLCKPPCLSCIDDASKCNSCIDNFILKGKQCVINSTTPTDTCHSSCQTCSTKNDPKACTQCPPQSYLTAGKECQPCTSPCSTCSGQSTTCTGCMSNYQLKGSNCEPICDSSCKTCSKPVDPQFCTSSCPEGSYLISGKCQRCKAPCQNCEDSEDKCTSCIDNYNLNGHSCSIISCHSSCLTCSKGDNKNACKTCKKNSYLTSQNECIPCVSPCDGCSGTDTNCTSCLSNYTFKQSKCELQCDSSCLTCSKPANSQACLTCKDGTYFDSNYCLRCKAPCLNCVDSENKCKSCIDNFTLKGNECVINSCHGTCLTCSNSTQTGCTSCIQSQYLSKNNECLPCKAPCQDCLNQENECTSCQIGYVLKGNECKEKSEVKEETTYIKKIECHPFCATCFGKRYDQCLSCAQNRVLKKTYSNKSQRCVCPEGTSDKKLPFCEKNSLQNNLKNTSNGFFGSSVAFSTLASFAASNPLMILSYADFAQSVSVFTYVNEDYAYDYDSSLQTMYISNINYPIKSISPNKRTSTSRLLVESDNQIVDEDKSNGNPKLFMNDRHPYFITNALILLIIISFVWIISYLCSRIKSTTTIKGTLRKIFYQSFPLILFIFTVQELCTLSFFQYLQMEFSTGLEVISSIGSILALIYVASISGYIFTSIEKLHYTYIPIQTSPDVSPTHVKNSSPTHVKNASKIHPSSLIPITAQPEQIKTNPNNFNSTDLEDLSERFYIIKQIFKQEKSLQRHFSLVIIGRKFITALVSTFCYQNPISQSVILLISYGIYFFLTIKIRPFQNIKYAIFSGVIETITFLMHIFLVIIISCENGSDTQLLISLVLMASTIIVSCLYTVIGVVLFIKCIYEYIKNRNKKSYDTVFFNQQPMQSRSQLDILDQSQNSPAKKHINNMNFNNQHFFRSNENNQSQLIIENLNNTPQNKIQTKQNQDQNFSAVSNQPSQLIKLEGVKQEDHAPPQNSAKAPNNQSFQGNQRNEYNNQSNNSSINQFVTNFGKTQIQQTNKK